MDFQWLDVQLRFLGLCNVLAFTDICLWVLCHHWLKLQKSIWPVEIHCSNTRQFMGRFLGTITYTHRLYSVLSSAVKANPALVCLLFIFAVHFVPWQWIAWLCAVVSWNCRRNWLKCHRNSRTLSTPVTWAAEASTSGPVAAACFLFNCFIS